MRIYASVWNKKGIFVQYGGRRESKGRGRAGFKFQPGLWALEEMRDKVLKKFELKVWDAKSEEQFTHGYYQGFSLKRQIRRYLLYHRVG